MTTAGIYAKKDHVAKDGSIPIYLRLTVNRKVYPIPVNKRTQLADWDDQRARVRSSHPNANLLNKFLDQTVAKANDVLLKHELTNRPITIESFRRELSGLSPYDFYYLSDQYRDSIKISTAYSTRQKIGYAIAKLKEFAARLELHQVDYAFIIKYVNHLKTVRKNSQNTVNADMKIFRRILRHGMKLKLATENPFLEYRLTHIKTERASLNLKEVKLYEELLSHQIPRHLRQTLCWFLLAVYTGRRYEDLLEFDSWVLADDHFRVVQMKRVTGRDDRKTIMIYTNDKIRSIVTEIQWHQYRPVSNQKANQYLKELNKMVGIKSNITFHSARHTFSNITKRLTPDLTVRRDLLGHDSIKSTLIYDHTDQEVLKETMLKWNHL